MIKIVTDSTCDIPGEMVENLGISIVPLHIQFDGRSYREFFELDKEVFYKRFEKGEIEPKTSQPSPGEFMEVYEPILGEGHDIISIHISGSISGTLNSAKNAREILLETYKDRKIDIVDSKSSTLGLGGMVLKTAEMLKTGESKESILKEISRLSENSYALIIIPDLQFLKKGGRISGPQAFIGNIMNIVPYVILEKGSLRVYGKAFGRENAEKKIIEEMKKILGNRSPEFIAAGCGSCRHGIDRLIRMTGEIFPDTVLMTGRIGAVIGSHLGPNAAGVIWF